MRAPSDMSFLVMRIVLSSGGGDVIFSGGVSTTSFTLAFLALATLILLVFFLAYFFLAGALALSCLRLGAMLSFGVCRRQIYSPLCEQDLATGLLS